MTICNVPVEISDNFLPADLSKYGCMVEVSLVKGDTEVICGDFSALKGRVFL